MRVLHLHDRLSSRGGADWHLLSLLEAGVEGCDFCLAVGRDDGSTRAPKVQRIFRVRGLGGRERDADEVLAQLPALLEEARPRVLHVHNVLQPRVLAALAEIRGRAGAPLSLVATVQDHRAFCPGRGKVLPDGAPCAQPMEAGACLACLEASSKREGGHAEATRAYGAWILELTRARLRALRAFPALVVLSRAMALHLQREGVDARRIHVIPPFPWGLGAYARRDDPEARFLGAGRVVWSKGFEPMLHAWREAGAPGHVTIAGDGPGLAALRRRVGTWPERSRIHLPGWVDHTGIGALLAESRALVLPSLWDEPFGIVGLEALSLGVPVVAFRVGGIPEWMEAEGEYAGWLLPPGDFPGLGRAMCEATDPGEAARRGALGRRLVEGRHDPHRLAAELREVYLRADAAL
jgi:glycosyltransferase involved in cell wall biosynthesis